MPTPELQPTERIPVVPEPAQLDEAQEPERRPSTRLAGVLGSLARFVLIGCVLIGALVAAALLVTPTQQSVLIMGTDARPDELARGEAGRTDTLLLFFADRATPRVAMVSVPRDLWVAIPGHGEERINAALELGGSQTAKQTVSNVLGQRVDRFVLIGLQGVRDIVDAAGGIDITVPRAIHDDTYPTDDYGYQTVDIPAGRQRMDGDIALKYARTRHQDNDFGRVARQQQVVAALRTRLLNPLNWPRIPAVAFAASQSIKSDVSPLDAVAIAAAVLRAGEPDRLVIDTSLVTPVTGVDGAYLLDPKRELKPAVARFLGTISASVEVLNAAGVAGLATRTAERLTQRGFQIVNVGDAARAQSQTSIITRPAARSTAERVAAALNLPTSRVTERVDLGPVDVQIILGADAH